MTTPVIARLQTVELQSWTWDSSIGAAPSPGRVATRRACPAVIAPNLNTAGGQSPKPPQNPAPPRPVHVDMFPMRLAHVAGQWLATGRFTHPATLDPAFAALLDPEMVYLLTVDDHDVVVTKDLVSAEN